MKKVLLGVLSVFMLAACTSEPTQTQTPQPTQESIDFGATQHESSISFSIDSTSGTDLSVYEPDFSDYYFMNESAQYIKGVTFKEALKVFGSDFTGLIFYGYPQCNFCNEALPVVTELSNTNQQTVYYVNVHMENYGPDKEDLSKFEEIAYPWYQDDREGGKSFFVPTLFAVVEGKIKDAHTGLLPGTTIDTSKPLSIEHHDELASHYTRLFDLVK